MKKYLCDGCEKKKAIEGQDLCEDCISEDIDPDELEKLKDDIDCGECRNE